MGSGKRGLAGGLVAMAVGGLAWGADGVPTLGEVEVQGTPLDAATTEGSGSYTSGAVTVAGKEAVPRREIPNSVSVVTRQQMDDQAMVTVTDALHYTTGVTAIPNDPSQAQFSARGYALGVMYDGMPAYSSLSGYQQFDLAIYDRVEVWRGPAGLLQGSDDPAGVVNLVRKKARSEFAANATLSTGSWNDNRADLDVTGPLNQDRSLRGRVVLSGESKDFFYDRAHDNRWLSYGELEYDLSSRTTLSLSNTVQVDKGPSWSGLPVSTTGSFLDVPRSTNAYPSWSSMYWRTEENVLAVEHHFDNQWVGKISLSQRDQRQDFFDAYPSSGVNPTTDTLSYMRRHYQYDYHRQGVDAYLTGPFQWLGRQHRALLGFNYDKFSYTYRGFKAAELTGIPWGDTQAVTQPSQAYDRGGANENLEHGVFGQVRLSLADPWKLTLGARVTDFSTRSRGQSPGAVSPWKPGAQAFQHVTPYGGLTYDLNPQWSLYASYSEIFMPQTAKTYQGRTLDPRVGSQYELGTKGELLDGKLNTSFAVFHIEDRNRAMDDPNHPDYSIQAGKAESKGWETEVSGSPLPGLELSAGYTNLITRLLRDDSSQGQPLNNWWPRHTLKLWGNYQFSGSLQGFSAGLGLDAMSRFSGNGSSASREQGGYGVVDARLGYRFTPKSSVSLNVKNLFDRVYFARIGGSNTYNTYGEPRSVMLTWRLSL